MRLVCIVLIALGLAVSSYLLFRHYALAGASDPLKPSVCSVLPGHDCDAALRSPLSKQLGLPLAGWGIVFYGTLLAVALMGWFLGDEFRYESALAALALSTLGAATGVLLFLTMALGKAPFCPLCVAVHAINLLLVPVCKRMARRPTARLVRDLVASGALLLNGNAGRDARGRQTLLATLAVALVGMVLYQGAFIQERLHAPPAFDVRHVLASFATSPRTEIPMDALDPCLGPPRAAVRLVVFSDFQCPGCRRLGGQMAGLAKGFGGKVEIVFKHFPMAKACNPALADERHPRACEEAWAAEAARRQGKFWAFHDSLFAAGLGLDDVALRRVARSVQLDLARFEADRHREDTKAKVKADVELGNRLGVDETPTIFVNGRRAPDVRMQSLYLLVTSEIAGQTRLPVRAKGKMGTPSRAEPYVREPANRRKSG